MQVEKDRSSHFGGRMHGLPVLALQLSTDEKKNIRAKGHKSKAYVLEYIISTINPSPSRLSAGKSLGIKPAGCLSFFSADKRLGSSIYCIHISEEFRIG